MARKIVLLSDGTGNSASKVWRTNVWRTFESLDLSNSSQVAFYDDGVGTSSFKPLAILGGAFGYGLKRNVIDLYKFVCRNYRSADDYRQLDSTKPDDHFENDAIYGFGFSRGAFTIRIVVGLIALARGTAGLLRVGTELWDGDPAVWSGRAPLYSLCLYRARRGDAFFRLIEQTRDCPEHSDHPGVCSLARISRHAQGPGPKTGRHRTHPARARCQHRTNLWLYSATP